MRSEDSHGPRRTALPPVPRVVRDVAKQCGKDVALEVSGQNTDLDKSILDALAEPLMHIVRNSVDHGMSQPTSD